MVLISSTYVKIAGSDQDVTDTSESPLVVFISGSLIAMVVPILHHNLGLFFEI